MHESAGLATEGRAAALYHPMETILVVDDERCVLKLTERLLVKAGYRVLTAESAAQAIAIVGEIRGWLDLLITDMVMPQIDGHELIQTIRRTCPLLKTFAMSGALFQDDCRARDYLILQKPFTRAQLLLAVRQVLGGARQQQHVF
jgi:CheY-like chemotaxis protein